MIGKLMEVYIDDVVVKSSAKAKHLDDLRKAFIRTRSHNLKMNPRSVLLESQQVIGFWSTSVGSK